MFSHKKKALCLLLIFGFVVTFLFETVEASKASKVAKTVAKGVIDKKLNKHHSRRWFPTWLIVLLVLGSGSGIIGCLVCAYCFWQRRSTQSQSCFV
ncbi:hypothetical protein JTE90_012290 [Oedothorax gibbosus]|uniref:Transmembrane protein n=1 Tax=Oedothorax gibbosus TaxID=931172 RepID=A0AAV6VLB2_9ARAC|nr:hypothetical protein JTE90_012290 [Oedothorax gibbosus]